MPDIVDRLKLNEDDWLFGPTARLARLEIQSLCAKLAESEANFAHVEALYKEASDQAQAYREELLEVKEKLTDNERATMTQEEKIKAAFEACRPQFAAEIEMAKAGSISHFEVIAARNAYNHFLAGYLAALADLKAKGPVGWTDETGYVWPNDNKHITSNMPLYRLED